MKKKKFNWAVGDWIGVRPEVLIDGEKAPWAVALAQPAPSGKHSFDYIYFDSRKEARAMYLMLKKYSDYLAESMYAAGHGDALAEVLFSLESIHKPS